MSTKERKNDVINGKHVSGTNFQISVWRKIAAIPKLGAKNQLA